MSETPTGPAMSGPSASSDWKEIKFIRQFVALTKKNLILAWRNKLSTFLQLFASFFFVLAVFVVDAGLRANTANETRFQNLRNPDAEKISNIPECRIRGQNSDCISIAYAFDSSISNPNTAAVQSILNKLAQNNDPTIPSSKIKSFENELKMDEWLLANPESAEAAVIFFADTSMPNSIEFVIQHNSTVISTRGQFDDTTFKTIMPLQNVLHREIARYQAGNPSSFTWDVSMFEFPHPALQTFSTVGTIGPLFFFAALLFSFVVQISALVAERELKLRQAMKTMGLLDSVYWASWAVWSIGLNLFSSLFLCLFGMIFQFNLFLKNDFLTFFFFFFLFQCSMSAVAFLISTFVRSTTTATSIGFIFFVVFFIFWFVVGLFGFPYGILLQTAPFKPRWWQAVFSFIPPNLLTKGLSDLGQLSATDEDKGLRWADRWSYCTAEFKCDPGYSIGKLMDWMIGLFFLYFTLALYFDNVLPDPQGSKKHPLYFLMPSYWGFDSRKVGDAQKPVVIEPSTDEDVISEEQAVQARQASSGQPGSSDVKAIEVRNLISRFITPKFLGMGVKREFIAVKGPWYSVEKKQLFALLGPNGAGKTTTINMLTGVLPASEGDARVLGHSIRTSQGMDEIRKRIGVCPQFDILWDMLTAKEHLQLFGRIRGIPAHVIDAEADKRLSQVKLTDSANVVSSAFSGGMKRRLSVSIALMGDPEVVFLDEPTTGMDPISRRHVWDIIEDAKQGRAVVLTTHSMEEADILGDRIAIMARGRLRCLGSSIRLKSRFGAGFRVSISASGQAADNVINFFQSNLGVQPDEQTAAYVHFVIPLSKESSMPAFFDSLRSQQAALGIADVQLGLCTLEDVFLNIARTAEMESAQAEGKTVTASFEGQDILVPLGAEQVQFEGSVLKVRWGQDEEGNLTVSEIKRA